MHYKEERPWGNFEQFTHNQKSTVKIITVKDGAKLSLQSHQKRDETWIILDGKIKVVLDDQTIETKPGQKFEIKQGQKHRLIGPGRVLEISHGDFDENDIERYEDDYQRC
ncbi:phosphomannose isomerase type II C-terminal cupin domain [Nanoarchaeota archaeon]